MKPMAIVGVIASSLGILFSFASIGSPNQTDAGIGVFNLILFGYFLALSIVVLKQK